MVKQFSLALVWSFILGYSTALLASPETSSVNIQTNFESRASDTKAPDSIEFSHMIFRALHVKDELLVRSGPGMDHEAFAKIPAGAAAIATAFHKDGWYRLLSNEGHTGWVSAKFGRLEAFVKRLKRDYSVLSYSSQAQLEVKLNPEDIQIIGVEFYDGDYYFRIWRESRPVVLVPIGYVIPEKNKRIEIKGAPHLHQRGPDPYDGNKVQIRGFAHCGPTAFQIAFKALGLELKRQTILDNIYYEPGAWEGFEGGMVPPEAIRYAKHLGFKKTRLSRNSSILKLRKNLRQGKVMVLAVIGDIFLEIHGEKDLYNSVSGHNIVLTSINPDGSFNFSDPNRTSHGRFANIESDFKHPEYGTGDITMLSEHFLKAWTKGGEAWVYVIE